MKFLFTLVLLLLVATFASCDQLKWSFCDPTQNNDTMKITGVSLTPDPPVVSESITVSLTGTLTKDVVTATGIVKVYYQGIELYSTNNLDLCATFPSIQCPVKAGPVSLQLTEVIPDIAPVGGPYTGSIQLNDQDGKIVNCLTFSFNMDEPSMNSINEVNDEDSAINTDIIKIQNQLEKSGRSTWRAGVNSVFSGMTIGQVKSKLMHRRFINTDPMRRKTFGKSLSAYPKHFDSRDEWRGCVHPIRNQQQCGSCWAFSAAESLSDRFCIASKGKEDVVLSPEYLVACDKSDYGCQGGFLNNAWEFMTKHGIPTDKCTPYVSGGGKTGSCPTHCKDGSPLKLYKAKNPKPLKGEEEMQKAIYSEGPIQAAFTVYSDFMTYKSGVYHHMTGGVLGGHAIKVIGWGVENTSGTPYWIVANSWGNSWGMNGFFWIKRGSNECGIEKNGYAGEPVL